MKITDVVINNYKSLGEDKNLLYLEDNITALIGKNDSGKSNILEALGSISFTKYINEDFFSKKNRYTNENICIKTNLKFTDKEIENLDIEVNNKNSLFIFYSSDDIEFDGGFSEIFYTDKELNQSISYLKQNIMLYFNSYNYYFNEDISQKIRNVLNRLLQIDSKIWIRYKKSLNEIIQIINLQERKNIEKENEEGYEYDELGFTIVRNIEIIKSKIRKKYNLLPVFYYRKIDEQLQSIYNLEEIKLAIKYREGPLYKFMIASEADLMDFITSIESEDDNKKVKSQNRIKEKIKYNIQKKFNYFYDENESIKIKVSFDYNCLKILVKINEDTTYISERSNGLRWFLNIFIDLISKKITDSNIVYLLDEPGIYLHVNAQRELLKLLKNLCNDRNQLVYTTHSPYMIDTENIINVRAIEKDENGITHIFNNAYDNKFNSVSKRETITPLLKAIGADIKYNLGPRLDRVNVITEGITDYMYLTAMMEYFDVPKDNRPYIIPSVGAGNVNGLVSILIGWGCNYKVILDYDKAGFLECNKLIENLDLTFNKDVFFINAKDKVDEKELLRYPQFIECLISDEDKEKLSIKYEENKTLAAKEFYDKVFNKKIILSDFTVENFRKLFEKIGIMN